MRIGEMVEFLCASFEKQKGILLVGPPGVGKTCGKMQAARRLGWDYYGICMPLADPAYLMGYPYRENGTAGHVPFGVLGKCLKSTRPCVLDLDEFGGATDTTQKAALRLVQFREVGEHWLPDHVVITASSNDIGHGAAVLGMIEPLKDRFDTIVQIEPNLDDTVVYGMANGWSGCLLAYLRNAKPTANAPLGALFDWKPEKSMKSGGATPRGWEAVAKWENDGFLDQSWGHELVCGKVGIGRGTEFMEFRRLQSQLPDLDSIRLDPEGAPVPTDMGARLFVAISLGASLTADNFGQTVKYLKRMDQMMRAYSIRDAFRAENSLRADKRLPAGYKPLSSAREFTAWACSDDGKAIMGADAALKR